MRWSILLLAACEHQSEPERVPAAPPVPAAVVVHDASEADARGRVVVTESDPCGLILDRIYFPAGQAHWRPHQEPVVVATAEMLVCMDHHGEHKDFRVLGHANAGEHDATHLAEARARAVVDALVAHGVPAAELAIGPVVMHRGVDERNQMVEFEVRR